MVRAIRGVIINWRKGRGCDIRETNRWSPLGITAGDYRRFILWKNTENLCY